MSSQWGMTGAVLQSFAMKLPVRCMALVEVNPNPKKANDWLMIG
jgi:hypothetical protein